MCVCVYIYIYAFVYLYRYVCNIYLCVNIYRGVMVNVIENGHSDQSSNPGRFPIALIIAERCASNYFFLQLWVNNRTY